LDRWTVGVVGGASFSVLWVTHGYVSTAMARACAVVTDPA
jgi:hypothetical protein